MKLPDFTKLFVVEPDASDIAIGAVFLQKYDDRLHSVVYFKNNILLLKKTMPLIIRSSGKSSELAKS